MLKTLKFKDGKTIECKIIAQALFVYLVKYKGNFYLISKYSLED